MLVEGPSGQLDRIFVLSNFPSTADVDYKLILQVRAPPPQVRYRISEIPQLRLGGEVL